MKFLGKCHNQYKFAYIFKIKSFCNAKNSIPKSPSCLAWNFWESAAYATLCPILGTEFLGKRYIYSFAFWITNAKSICCFGMNFLGIRYNFYFWRVYAINTYSFGMDFLGKQRNFNIYIFRCQNPIHLWHEILGKTTQTFYKT